ncbi:MAG: hypothetical protein CM15mP17_03660 [Gammaproteobacteria bacterium]|nr:MAG: hypothetical protein CM15mP17_03660 [Gammaproteobacteria bacterium]
MNGKTKLAIKIKLFSDLLGVRADDYWKIYFPIFG